MAEPRTGHESSGVATRRILQVGALLAAGVILAVIAVILVLQESIGPARSRAHAQVGPVPPAPRLQTHSVADLAALRAQKEAQLEGWGWTGDTRQYAHIPIEHAMVIYARQHEAVDAERTR